MNHAEQSTDDSTKEKPKRKYPIKVVEIVPMHEYFWGTLKALATIKIPGFTIRGMRIVQEEGKEEFKVYPPREFVGRRQRNIFGVVSKHKKLALHS